MLPIYPQSSPELQTLKKPAAFTVLRTQISSHPRLWLFLAFLFVQTIVVFFTRTGNSPVSLSVDRHFPAQTVSFRNSTERWPLPAVDGECEFGRVYVYDLPSMFNKDLATAKCDDLDPWRWQCGLVTNDGYGKQATELAQILPENISTAWYRTNQFSSEVIFHHRILNYRCRTLEPRTAMAFYMPFYAGLAVGKYLWQDDIAKRDWHSNKLLEWVQNQTYWKRSNGSDHFITLGRITWDFRRFGDPERQWGSNFLNQPAMQQVTRFTIEKALGVDYEVGIPYPTGLHPQSDSQLKEWQSFVRSRNRTSLFTFIGATRGSTDTDFRSLLMSYCYNESDACRVVDCAVTQCSYGAVVIQETLLSSDFCLQPKGDSLTRRSIFDCMVAGSVPVFFWRRSAYEQYQWFLPGEPESYSVFIKHEDVRNGTSIRKVLESFSKEEVRRMREKVIETIPRIVYAKPSKGLESTKDAFDIAVEEVLKRIKEEKDFKEWTEEIDYETR